MILFSALYGVLLLLTLVPLTPFQHWFFRLGNYIKIQLFSLQIIFLILGILFFPNISLVIILSSINTISIIHSIYIFYPYSKFHKERIAPDYPASIIKMISANVYQENKKTSKLIQLIQKISPDLFITLESNKFWENALDQLIPNYPHSVKVPLENTYGMHLYSNLPILDHQVHYFMADDVPSIEANLQLDDGQVLKLLCAHPPPASPTEESNAKERDGELMAIAELVAGAKYPTVVIGDFNNVPWSNVSRQFRRVCKVHDARVGVGMIYTFHSKYPWFRLPLDLAYHTSSVYVHEIKALEDIGSDHFPLFLSISVDHSIPEVNVTGKIDPETQDIMEDKIEAGKKEISQNRNSSYDK